MASFHGPDRDRIAQLERENAAILNRLAALEGRDPFVDNVDQVWLAQTYSSSPEGYPDPPADTFDIRFIRPKLDVWSPGDRTPTLTPRSASGQSVAAAYDGRYLLRNTICEVMRIGTRWWIIGSAGLEHFGRTKSSLSKGGTVSVDLLQWNGTKLIDTGKDLTGVQDKFLNSNQTLGTPTKVQVRLEYPGKYFITNANCAIDDTDPEDYAEEE